jgi:RNA polymerase sigma-70 factor (ECF subfamily)
VKSYLFQTAKNISLNYIKRAKIEGRVLNVVENNSKNTINLLENELVYNEYSELAKAAIDMLPVKRKEIFKLRLHDDLSLDEISQKLHISKSVVKKQLYSGMNFVRGYLSRHGAFTILMGLLFFYKK